MTPGWHDETDDRGFRRCYRWFELRTEIPPNWLVTRDSTPKRARVDVPPWDECLAIAAILVPAIVGGLIAGAGWIVARMFRRG